MATGDIRPKDLPRVTSLEDGDAFLIDGATTRSIESDALANILRPLINTATVVIQTSGELATANLGTATQVMISATSAIYTDVGTSKPSHSLWVKNETTGHYWSHTGPVVTSRQCGCMIDGVADDAAALRKGRDYIATIGGGVLLLEKGVHLCKTTRAGQVIEPASDMTIQGYGDASVLKWGDNLNTQAIADGATRGQYLGIYPKSDTVNDRADRFTLRNFMIDANGANNQASGVQNYDVGVLYGDDVVYDGVTIINSPGAQALRLGRPEVFLTNPSAAWTAKRGRIINCRIHNLGNTVNPNMLDSSAIFTGCDGCIIENNIITNDVQDTLGTGIEMHGKTASSGNIIDKVATGFNVGSLGDTIASDSGSVVTNCYNIYHIWNDNGNATYNDVSFTSNGLIGRMVDSSIAAAVDCSSNINVGGPANRISVQNYDIRSAETAGTSNVWPAFSVGPGVDHDFSNGYIEGFSGRALEIGSSGVRDGFTTIRFNNVTIRDCCKSANSSYKTAVAINAVNELAAFHSRGCRFENTGTLDQYMTKAYGGNAPFAARYVDAIELKNVSVAQAWSVDIPNTHFSTQRFIGKIVIGSDTVSPVDYLTIPVAANSGMRVQDTSANDKIVVSWNTSVGAYINGYSTIGTLTMQLTGTTANFLQALRLGSSSAPPSGLILDVVGPQRIGTSTVSALPAASGASRWEYWVTDATSAYGRFDRNRRRNGSCESIFKRYELDRFRKVIQPQRTNPMPNLDSGGAPPRLVPGWQRKLTKWWSMKVAWFGIVFWSALAGLWVIWPAFVEKIPLWAYAVGGVAMSIALGVARVLKQPGLD